MTKKEKITAKAKEIIEGTPAGVRFSELVSQLRSEFPEDPYGTITGTIWNINEKFPYDIYKPSRGVFRLLKFKEEPACSTLEVLPEAAQEAEADATLVPSVVRELHFYQPFADYLIKDLEECTNAVALGGSKFGSKWGTPDVFSISKSRESDIVKMPIEVVVAEIKIDTSQLITAFGQSCAYKLFAHRSYLVIPKDSQPEDLGRLDALCQIFGIGLIFFDSTDPKAPNFDIRVRASRHEPDSFYVNQCVKQVADKLGL